MPVLPPSLIAEAIRYPGQCEYPCPYIDAARVLHDCPLSGDVVEKVGVELFAKFSRVVLPLTDAAERRVGRSEGSIFPPAG